ncbi:hypothetical protein N0V93_006680 [Gnomoniopsis smithogilvyi]|uniref:Copper homeostasis protein cutC homolog n=1 Tax=Gnomoniopsis smithogilvyi TaxID=1191159 RepID=A0A9W8YNN6_9PEZI|nr:hypothetical protein N0V93_006680 [Gnomoniopsis smithogilvyi]
MDQIYLEVPVFSSSSADSIIHADHGIARLELNAEGSYSQGGTTPDANTYRHVVVNKRTPLRVMIRPRGPPDDGTPDFVYSRAEFDGMIEAIRKWQSSGILDMKRGDGFVFGALTSRAEDAGDDDKRGMRVDVERNSQLVDMAAPYPCVFHRAFDDVLGSGGSTVEEALSDLAVCGFKGLLTSGGPGRAIDNIDIVSRIVRAAPQSLREVIIGGGVRSSHVRKLAEVLLPQSRETLPTTTDIWFHSSCLMNASASEEVDKQELSSIAEQVKAVYESV